MLDGGRQVLHSQCPALDLSPGPIMHQKAPIVQVSQLLEEVKFAAPGGTSPWRRGGLNPWAIGEGVLLDDDEW